MSVIQRLGRIDNRIIYTLLILVLVYPLARPIGLPISVSEYTRNSYEVIDSLQAGDVVLFDVAYSVAGAGDVEPQALAVTRHLFSKGVKIIFVAYVVEGPQIVEMNLLSVPEAEGKVYGEDYVNLGYLAGRETAIATYARGLKQAFPLDSRGNPTSELALLQDIDTAGDVDLFMFFTAANSDMYVRQITPYNVPIIGGLINAIAPQAEPYVHAGQLDGILIGLRGGAEYETQMGRPGVGVASMDAQSMGHLLFIGFILFANLAYFTTRGRGGKGAAR